jgi:hypothetical protein
MEKVRQEVTSHRFVNHIDLYQIQLQDQVQNLSFEAGGKWNY